MLTLAAAGLKLTSTQGVRVEELPCAPGDATAGTENELQAVVVGERHAVSDFQHYLCENRNRVWENSWVRFPRKVLSQQAQEIFRLDLLNDRRAQLGGMRPDADRVIFQKDGEEWVRIPVSNTSWVRPRKGAGILVSDGL